MISKLFLRSNPVKREVFVPAGKDLDVKMLRHTIYTFWISKLFLHSNSAKREVFVPAGKDIDVKMLRHTMYTFCQKPYIN